MEKVGAAFEALQNKINRIKKTGDYTFVKQKDDPFENLKEKVVINENERKEKIKTKFNQYQNPVSKEIEEDENSILKAYELFCKVQDLNATSETESASTFISALAISAPITKKTEYTTGLDFAFLQAWFLVNYKEKAVCFMPVILQNENGFALTFCSGDNFAKSKLLKEILFVIEDEMSIN